MQLYGSCGTFTVKIQGTLGTLYLRNSKAFPVLLLAFCTESDFLDRGAFRFSENAIFEAEYELAQWVSQSC